MFSITSQGLLRHASTLDEMISLMDYKVLKLEDASSPHLPAGKTQSTSPLFLSDSHSEATPSVYTPLFFSYPVPLISGLWYRMNRERDPVGVDPLMHPPVALTLIPFSVKLP